MLRRARSRIRNLRYGADPVAFVHDCIAWDEGQRPTDYQDEILARGASEPRVAVRGPHGCAKTTICSWRILHWYLTRDDVCDWKCPTTASAWRQLDKYLWPEVHKWARRLRWDVLQRDPFVDGKDLLDLALKGLSGEAFAVASNQPALIEGAHADSLLFCYDEAKFLPDEIWNASEGAFSGQGEVSAFAISTPGPPNGRFYDIHARKPGYEDWWCRHITLEEAIRAGRVSRAWAEAREREWGADSPIFRTRVLGEFAADDEEGVIPLAWVEAAMARWEDLLDYGKVLVVGIDVADTGTDDTAMALGGPNGIAQLHVYPTGDTMQTTGRAAAALGAPRDRARAVVDVIGVGAGVAARLKELGYRVDPFNASSGTHVKDRTGAFGFLNLRAAAWWGLRERLDPATGDGVILPRNDRLLAELVVARWRVTSAGKIQIEAKDEIRKRLGRSPDCADAVVMACWQGAQVPARTGAKQIVNARY